MPPAERAGNRSAWPWFGLLAVSLLVRGLWWVVYGQVIETEGSNYARVAENLARGIGFVGLDELGPQIIYPPLYPGLAAAFIALGLSSEAAGRLVSLVFGSLTPLVLAAVVSRLHERRTGWWAGAVAAVHPLLIAGSVSVLSESTYLFLALAGTLAALSTFDAPKARRACATGLVFGLAFLCRPEALFICVLVGACLAWMLRRSGGTAVKALAALFLGFSCLALPYAAYLHGLTGQWRLEAKSPQGVLFQVGAAAGKSSGEIFWGIDADLNGRGLSNTSDVEQARTPLPPPAMRLRMAAWQARGNLPELGRALLHGQLGGPIVLLLAAAGLVQVARRRLAGGRDVPLLALALLAVGPFLVWPFMLDRAMFTFAVCLVAWACIGAASLHEWLRTRLPPRVVHAVAGLAVVVAVVTAWSGVRRTDEMSQAWSASLARLIPIGRWLGATAPKARIADTGPTVAFYAGSPLVRLPWTDAATAVRYLARQRVEYVVLHENSLGARPYLREWAAAPAAHSLTLVKTFASPGQDTWVYRLSPPASAGQP